MIPLPGYRDKSLSRQVRVQIKKLKRTDMRQGLMYKIMKSKHNSEGGQIRDLIVRGPFVADHF